MKLLKEQKILVFLGVTITILYVWSYNAIALKFINFFFERKILIEGLFGIFWFPALVLISFLISVIGILYFKRWALRLYFVSVTLVSVSSLKTLMLISYYSILGISNISLLLLSAVALWFSMKKTTIEHFGMGYISARREKFRKLNRISKYFSLVFIIGLISYYAI
ncbi:MAG: hypothetical protein KKC42_00250, partial [Candidatus Omnitrophica bacterium]|nr:hypothetical protein [Candidatus Omnitrophota bacterium]